MAPTVPLNCQHHNSSCPQHEPSGGAWPPAPCWSQPQQYLLAVSGPCRPAGSLSADWPVNRPGNQLDPRVRSVHLREPSACNLPLPGSLSKRKLCVVVQRSDLKQRGGHGLGILGWQFPRGRGRGPFLHPASVPKALQLGRLSLRGVKGLPVTHLSICRQPYSHTFLKDMFK